MREWGSGSPLAGSAPTGARLTRFEGMGMGLSDMAVAAVVVAEAEWHYGGLMLEQRDLQDVVSTCEDGTAQ